MMHIYRPTGSDYEKGVAAAEFSHKLFNGDVSEAEAMEFQYGDALLKMAIVKAAKDAAKERKNLIEIATMERARADGLHALLRDMCGGKVTFEITKPVG